MEMYKPSLDEWEKLKRIRLEALEKEPTAFKSKLQEEALLPKEKWQKWIGQGEHNSMFFAKFENEIVGMMGMFEKEGTAHIWGVYVSKDYRGKGIGKLLMQAILQEITSRQYSKAELTVNATQLEAISLYESFGFSIVETTEVENEKKYLMEKQISI